MSDKKHSLEESERTPVFESNKKPSDKSSKYKERPPKPKKSHGWIEVSKASYSPGDVVTGTVHMMLEEDYSTTFLVIKGKEKAAGDVGREFKYKKKTIFKAERTLDIPERGYLKVPFSFALPKKIPNSFEYMGKKAKFSVRYSIRAQGDIFKICKCRVNVYSDLTSVPSIPKELAIKEDYKKMFKKAQKVNFSFNIPDTQLRNGDQTRFEVNSSSPFFKDNQKANVFASLFLVMQGKGPFKGVNLVVPRCETPSERGENQPLPCSYKVDIKPQPEEQPTEASFFKASYGLGCFEFGVTKGPSILRTLSSINLLLDNHIKNGIDRYDATMGQPTNHEQVFITVEHHPEFLKSDGE